MGKLLDLKLEIDQRLLAAVNFLRLREKFRLTKQQRMQLQRSDRDWKASQSGKCLICGNGPSLDELNFSTLSCVPSFSVNYFYRHSNALALNPNYHVIIDGKITDGTWPVTMIDEVLEMFPKATVFLDVRWLHMSIMNSAVRNDRIYWVLPNAFPHANAAPKRSFKGSMFGLNVVATSISIATSMGYQGIGIAGVDGDGLFREILDMQSHFYDGEKDTAMMNFESMVKSLELSTQNLWAWQGLVKVHGKHGVSFVNLVTAGILNCMPRVKQDVFWPSKASLPESIPR